MEYKGLERRTCLRFEIPGSTISYKTKKILISQSKYQEEFCPLKDISRGGLRFLCQSFQKINSKISLKISIPGERVPLMVYGRVRWCSPQAGQSYKYQIGVQFNPYGEKKDQNYPGTLVKIIALEQKFSSEIASKTKDCEEEFSTDG